MINNFVAILFQYLSLIDVYLFLSLEGAVCLPPETRVCTSYAQLATAAPCMLRRTESMASLLRCSVGIRRSEFTLHTYI